MKIQRLRISRYGHFQDVELPFGENGVQMVVGPNEAGKSTLLEFVRELLFDFAVQNRYAFAATRKKPVEGGATLIMKDGRRVELTRRKATKNKVTAIVEGEDAPRDERGFDQLLGGASSNLFRSIFAFGLDELAKGGEALADPNIKSTLFGGGSGGLANPKKVIEALKADAEKLFAPTARTREINQILTTLNDLPKQIRDKSLACKAFEQSREELAEAEAEVKKATDELIEANRELKLRQKLADAFPAWVELDRLRGERAELTAPDHFPAGGLARFNQIETEIDRLKQDRDAAREDVSTIELDMAAIRFDAQLIDRRAAIDGLNEAIGSVKEARDRIPIDKRKRDDALRRATEQRDALIPSWSLDDLRNHRPTAAQMAAFDRLKKQKADRDSARGELTARRDGHLEALRDKEADLEALGDPVDVAPLTAILADEADHKNNLNERSKLEKAHREAERAIADLLPRLNPPLASPSTDAASLPVPPPETVEGAKREFDHLNQQIHTSEANINKDEADLRQLEAELAKMEVRTEALPTLEALDALRAARDDAWDLLRRKHAGAADATIDADILAWLADQTPESTRDLWDVHSGLVREADHHADALLNQAKAVAKHGQIQAARARLRDARRELDDQLARRDRALEAWRALWADCGFVPLDPEAMAGWLNRIDKLRNLRGELEAVEREKQIVGERIEAFETRLRDLTGEPTGDPAKLLAAVRERERAIRAADQSRESLESDCRKLRKRADEAEALLLKLEAEEPAWSDAWRSLLLELRLPADWDADLADRVLRDLKIARGELEKVDDAEADIAAGQARLADFEPKVRELAEALAPDLLDEAPEHAAAVLLKRLRESERARDRKEGLEKTLAGARKRLADLEAKLAAEAEARSALLEAVGVDSSEAFREIAAIAERIQRLDQQIDDKKREIDILRGREPADAFLARLQEADQAVLDADRDEAEEKHAKAEQRRADAIRNAGSCETTFAQFQKGSDEAALLQEQVTAKRADLAAGVDRYVPLVFARVLLNRAIERFEEHSQPEVLREASTILQTVTGGRFTRVARPIDDDGQLRVHRFDDEIFDPLELSTGSREQLYLAIRLAYVLHYCGRAEPLPVVMDDVMANFDDQRAANTLRALNEVSKKAQIIMFTCHPHFIDIGREVLPGLQPIEVPEAATADV